MKDDQVAVAFDFDGVVADDESRRSIRKRTTSRNSTIQAESRQCRTPRPVERTFSKLSIVQQLEEGEGDGGREYKPKLRISIVTARNAPSHESVINTMRNWGQSPVEAFFLGGIEKKKVLEVLNPHLLRRPEDAPDLVRPADGSYPVRHHISGKGRKHGHPASFASAACALPMKARSACAGRGDPKEAFATQNWYDPQPGAETVKARAGAKTPAQWAGVRQEVSCRMRARLRPRQLRMQSNFSVGCYCEDETRCHRGAARCWPKKARRSPPAS